MWRLSQDWYGDRLSPSFKPRTVAEAQALLDKVGLTSEYWQLQP